MSSAGRVGKKPPTMKERKKEMKGGENEQQSNRLNVRFFSPFPLFLFLFLFPRLHARDLRDEGIRDAKCERRVITGEDERE